MRFSRFNSNLINEDSKKVKQVFGMLYEEIKAYVDENISCNDIATYLKASETLFNNLNTEPKIKDNRFRKAIINWLLSINFVETLFNEIDQPKNIIPTEIIEYNETKPKQLEVYIRRQNQQEVYDKLEKYGLQTGIHCQATGCGKS